ncbi:uncharacterized protein BX664DRAFT_269248 [Halteromyces radiatus]|uniref:uncharacterized protein n=1 Tax=Halteromyces radiatus TaxID=101107 RepID=UPI002220D011|nr:uncharacterized protein BX664DRAFT_269248 [Halteromyces radiatus]KAI8079806.1 hypothetical protein BX664DRAFT_269248 [Halteromyces radiatus]
MALRLLSKNAAVAAASRPALMNTSRKTAGVAFTRAYSSTAETKVEEKKASVLDSLPGNSVAAKAAYLTTGAGLATFLISKEIYILNEETLVLVGSVGLLGVLLKYLREPFTAMSNEHINRIKTVLNQARDDHQSAVQERIDQVGQMKDLVDVTKTLFELSRETARLEAEAFTLKQQVAVAQEVKSTLDSWVRHETSVREREQKQLAAYLIEKIQKDLQDPTIQQQILDQAVLDVQSKCI